MLRQELMSPCCNAPLDTYGHNPWENIVQCIDCGATMDYSCVVEHYWNLANKIGATVVLDDGDTIIEVKRDTNAKTWGWREWDGSEEIPILTKKYGYLYPSADAALSNALDVLW